VESTLEVHGGKQEYGVHYWETYSPVVTWASLRLLLILSVIHNWVTKQIDFVLAFPQADAECDLYLKIPPCFELKGTISRHSHLIKMIKNQYGSKQAGRVWQLHLKRRLMDMGFKQSDVHECVFFLGSLILACYVDNCWIIHPDRQVVNDLMKEISVKFNITDKGDLNDFLGINVTHHADGTVELMQPKLIKRILLDMNLQPSTKTKRTPGRAGHVLQKYEDADPHKADWE